ncbi:hypothetical protein BDU57DRAFT_443137 [Ampelomyces quisqualis]|uniref:Developmental regulatory protein wetA n=1 Tax=Ampelomyces quisqualis TaxID=50730 RepID=A0A6A5QTZ4_AMPQU|nr:hypothetical protein BDU57DRAFT_443137 [Ampelomyces quisqualis]
MDTVDLDQLFEEYVETGLLQHCSDPTVDRSSSEDLAQLFELSSSNDSAVYSTTPILDRDEHMAWQQAVQKSGHNPALTMSNDSLSFHVDAKGKELHSDSELLIFEDLLELERNQLRSYSQPSTPRPHTTKSVKKAVSFHQDRSIARGIHKLSRKTSTPAFAKMMQPSFYRSPLPDMWKGKMDNVTEAYSLRVPPNGITSPPPSSKLVQNENSSGFFAQQHQPYAEDQSPLGSPITHHNDMDFANYQMTPQASPAIGISTSNSNNNDPFTDNMGLTFSSSVSSAALSALQTPPSSLRIPMTTWGPTDASPSMDFGYSASPDFSSTKTAGWWDGADASTVGPTYRESNQRSTSQYSSNASMEGLGISCDSASFGDFGVRGLGISTSEPMNARNNHHSAPASTHANAQPRQASQSANVGFVNFTPHDSRKILTGVAPSGSSKTKARREKEAAEKRRKLSEAAMKAVIEAGGDVGSLRRLEREGLLVLES